MEDTDKAAAPAEKPAKPKKAKGKNGHGGKRAGAGRHPAPDMNIGWDRGLDVGFDLRHAATMDARDILLASARLTFKAALKRGGRVSRTLLKDACDFARMASPYFHPHYAAHMLGWRPNGAFAGKVPAIPAPAERTIGGGVAPIDNGRRVVSITEAAGKKAA